MKFSEYVKHRWADYARTVGPAAVFFTGTPFITSVSWWFAIVAPLALMFLAGLIAWKQYNHWYSYYNEKTGLLRNRK